MWKVIQEGDQEREYKHLPIDGAEEGFLSHFYLFLFKLDEF